MNPNAAIHVAKTQLGLDDDTYRAMLHRVTGKRSSAEMTPAERGLVLDEMRRQGFEMRPPASRGSKTRGAMHLDGPFAGKIRALWIAGWNLGVVKDRTDMALVAFVRRQTGIDHVSWVRDPKDSTKAIEALKAWLAREAGVKWPSRGALPHSSKKAIIAAQLAILGLAPDPAAPIGDLDGYIADLGAQVRSMKS